RRIIGALPLGHGCCMRGMAPGENEGYHPEARTTQTEFHMGKTQYYTATTLDGYIADEHHSLDWLMQLGDPEETSYPAFIADVGAIAMGASTYEWILKHLVATAENETGDTAWPYTQPVWV